jgi:hypothetical protein
MFFDNRQARFSQAGEVGIQAFKDYVIPIVINMFGLVQINNGADTFV